MFEHPTPYIMRPPSQSLELLLSILPINVRMLELGSYAGESTEQFLNSQKIDELYAVDFWMNGYDDSVDKASSWCDMRIVENEFDKRMEKFKFKVVKLKMTSKEARYALRNTNAKLFDFIYLDGDHRLESITEDITEWRKFVIPGGILAGHDYGVPVHPGVKQAVDSIFANRKVQLFPDTSWAVRL